MNGTLIKRTRMERGWSREKLAVEAGCSYSSIRNIEAGRAPNAKYLRAIATALDLSLDDIYPAVEDSGAAVNE